VSPCIVDLFCPAVVQAMDCHPNVGAVPTIIHMNYRWHWERCQSRNASTLQIESTLHRGMSDVKRESFITSAKEGMFYAALVCLFVSRITRKLLTNINELFLKGCGVWLTRTDYILMAIRLTLELALGLGLQTLPCWGLCCLNALVLILILFMFVGFYFYLFVHSLLWHGWFCYLPCKNFFAPAIPIGLCICAGRWWHRERKLRSYTNHGRKRLRWKVQETSQQTLLLEANSATSVQHVE